MLGVNVIAHTTEELKAVMVKEKLTFRSFGDDGSIANRWNSPPTPGFYIIDDRGVIRQKWYGHPGEQAIDQALAAQLEGK